MRILAIDIGTGTQDILLFDSALPIENNIKLVMPSPTRMAERRVREATRAACPLILTGVIQGGGPCHWAVEDHVRAGYPVCATPEAAKTFDDDLAAVAAMGITVMSEDEARNLDGVHVEFKDLDLPAIETALAAFGVSLDADGLALACLDHGAAPPGYSDRLFRFDHLRRVVERRNDLRAFAMLPGELPDYLTRARTIVSTAGAQSDAAIVFLDTGPAAALGALQDEHVAAEDTRCVLNLGNMHTLAFHLDGTRIISLYEHHTGEVTREQIEDFTTRLLSGELEHEEVFNSKGHGVFYSAPMAKGDRPAANVIAVTGPQRGKIRGSSLKPYFAAPHGDMMISGCFGLLVAYAEKFPDAREEIERSLST
jgi:uncharacterized protein (DUF1786 family)